MIERDADESSLRIGEAARLVGVSASTLRAWEREGLVSPARGAGRQRLYSAHDVARLRHVRTLIERGYGHRALRRMLAAELPPDEELAGARLRTLRTKHGLSLRKAAQAAGVSIAHLSLVERGLATPTVALLQRIAAAYGGTLLELFDATEGDGTAGKLVRAGERRRLQGFDRVQMEDLVRFPDAALQVEIFTVEPGGGSGGGYAHEGEEAIFVLEGCLQVLLDESERYDLAPGDTLYFRSTQVHRWHNPGATPARVFWVNTPPTF
jgi:DNA-binding transcriptional MerR regulator/quercetin dioxygenase-like cupin family protein